jgi:beta-lactamase superfamily II metal-dependent hydrolase
MGIKLLVMAVITVWAAIWFLPDNNLHLVFCDVGQGDAVLVTHKTYQILVDGGPGKKVLECLEKHIPFYDRKIEVVILTHDNFDHSRGLDYVQQRYQVGLFEPRLRKGQTINAGKISYHVLWPEEKVLGADTISTENDVAIVGEVEFGSFQALLTADAASKNYENIDMGIEVVKVPHHGSKFELEPEWWKRVKPQLAVISVGKNSYGHPAEEVINLLSNLGIETLRTDKDGEIGIVSNGEKWWVEK